jgi:hypothetical protein
MDWVQFLNGYDAWPPLQSRLQIVREQLTDALSGCSPGSIRLISLCAGDGRDVIGTMPDHPRRDDTTATLIENNAELVARGQAAIAHLGLSAHIRFVCADATLSDTYVTIVPAEVVVLAGVLGNVQPAAEPQLIDGLRGLCSPGGSVIWTRGVGNADGQQAAERIRRYLAAAGFRERVLTNTKPHSFVVGTHVFEGTPRLLTAATKLFEFTDYDQMTSS